MDIGNLIVGLVLLGFCSMVLGELPLMLGVESRKGQANEKMFSEPQDYLFFVIALPALGMGIIISIPIILLFILWFAGAGLLKTCYFSGKYTCGDLEFLWLAFWHNQRRSLFNAAYIFCCGLVRSAWRRLREEASLRITPKAIWQELAKGEA